MKALEMTWALGQVKVLVLRGAAVAKQVLSYVHTWHVWRVQGGSERGVLNALLSVQSSYRSVAT